MTAAAVLAQMARDSGISVRDPFYTEFESPRLAAVLREIAACMDGRSQSEPLRLLDFGYLTGLVPRTLLGFLPINYNVIDHPNAPVFSNAAEQTKLISQGIRLHQCALESAVEVQRVFPTLGQFDVILLGEIVEHLDPTAVANLIARLRSLLKPAGRLIVTTPNLFGIANIARHLVGKDVQAVPLGHEVMIQGHIHLWSPSILKALCEQLGLHQKSLFYFHGLEGTQYVQSNHQWRSLGYQIWHKGLHAAACLVTRWQGFFVTSFSLKQ